MKNKASTFLEGFKKVVFNQRGSIGEESSEVESSEVEEVASEENTEAVLETSQESSEEPEEIQATTEKELETEIKDAIEEGATEEDVQNMIRQYTLKVDGREFIKEIDLDNEEEIIKQLQLAAKGQKSMQELQELKNVYTQNLTRLMEDPFAVLKELDENFDPLELSAGYIDALLKEQEMSPEEKAGIERQREFEEIKEERDRLKNQAIEKERESQRMALAGEIENDIMSALDGDSELVADKETVALVAENLMWAAKNNMHDISAKDVLPTVKEQLKRNFQKAASRFKTTDALKQSIGTDILERLREERVEQASKVVKNANSIGTGSSKSIKEPEREKIKLSSLFK